MPDSFRFDVFLSYSARDKTVVRDIARRLEMNRLKVWSDEPPLHPSHDIFAKTDEALEHSRVLVLCMSANAFGLDWPRLESQTLRFRDPLNKNRRFIPLRLDDSPLRGALEQFPYVDWRAPDRNSEFTKLVEACRPPSGFGIPEEHQWDAESLIRHITLGIDVNRELSSYVFTPDGRRVLSGSSHNRVQLWDLANGRCLKVLGRIIYNSPLSLAWTKDHQYVLSGANDNLVLVWDLAKDRCLNVLKGHTGSVLSLVWSNDQKQALSGSRDSTIRLWDVASGSCLRKFYGHQSGVASIAWSDDGRFALSGSLDRTIRLWEVRTGHCVRTFEGHTGAVNSVTLSPDQRSFLSGSADRTIRVWDIETGNCLRILEGHTDSIFSVALSSDTPHCLSGAADRTVRVWNMETGLCLRVLGGHKDTIRKVSWSVDGCRAFSGDKSGHIRLWELSELIKQSESTSPFVSSATTGQMQYTNAKVLLVGDTGSGKTGLSKRLVFNTWKPSDSTVGAWATQWKLPVSLSDQSKVEREIWLWDFGGQADQRLIHQLYMDETALAVLVFDGQKDDLFETLGQWDRDLTRASRKDFSKLLVAGRVDAGGLRVSRIEVEKFAKERRFKAFLETSAKKNRGCEELRQTIVASINWDEIPCRTTEILFKRLKEEIIRLKDKGRVLMRFNELRETVQLRLSGESSRFNDEELGAVLTLLAGPGVVWELAFGSWILLQPERINAYAQAVIRTLQEDEHQRGCLMEERVLTGDLTYESSIERLPDDEERFVLLAMHQTLVERGLCLRQPTATGNLLVFPSYYRRERPEQVKFPAVLVNYRFTGFLDEIYATLVVRLHHTEPFQRAELWRYAADFTTNTGKQLGVKLTRSAPGLGELEVYFEPTVAIEEKIIFSKYVHEHLLQHARDVERLRHYVCSECGTPVGNREIAMKRLNDWLEGRATQPNTKSGLKFRKSNRQAPSIICVGCEKRVPLWDEMEQSFASPEIQQRVRDMQEESAIVLDNESKERVLVGEVISTVALAGQICREFNVSDHGIDMEIEFKDDSHEATGAKLYLQLKSGDSYRRKRKRDGSEIFTMKEDRHARYWMAQAFPVLLVIRTSDGEVQWMEVRDWLKRANSDGKKMVKQIVFQGERFDVMSVRRWRDRVLASL